MMNPLRRSSNGKHAVFGSSTTDKARILVKPAAVISLMVASAPPAIMASACPWRIILNASPMALVPDAHAVTAGIAEFLQLKRIAIIPDAILAIIIGIKYGETLRGPFSKRAVCSVMKVLIPPIPEPIYTPMRSGAMVF